MTTPTKEQLDELERREKEVARINTEARGTLLDSIGMARLTAAHEQWGVALKAAAPALIQAAREREELVAFLREHGSRISDLVFQQVDAAPDAWGALDALLERFGKR